ncbi:MAG: MOFRL family protein, partial [Acidiferrobacterales bacterium]|nr:MOFRL family protein [Acidiferrobacterales bacterium]
RRGSRCRPPSDGGGLAQRLLAADTGAVHVWGGETQVILPAQPGRGGRSQSLALAAALALRDHADVLFLAAGTDGTDGPGEDAGALVDGTTVKRGTARGLDAEQALARADAGTFLEASGDLLRTGPTGTNVMDLMLGLRY